MSKTVIYGARRGPRNTNVLEGYSNVVENEPIELQDRQIVGILYSISGNEQGELFPVYAGRNMIGNSPACDIYLPEQSVALEHALLLMRRIKLEDGRIVASSSITDNNSDTGTWVNGESVGFDRMDCKDHSVLQIGNHYKLLFVELDPEAYGLTRSETFRAVPKSKKDKGMPQQVTDNYIVYDREEDNYPTAIGEQHEMDFYGRSKPKDVDHDMNKTIGQ